MADLSYMGKAKEEIEFKAGVDSATLARLRRLPVLRRATKGAAQTRLLLSVYYDTEDFSLAAAGLFLRMRRVAGHWEQTVKAARRAQHGLQRVVEANQAASGPDPDLALIPSPSLREAFRKTVAGRDLVPVCRSEIRRTTRLLQSDAGTVELAFDAGRVTAGGLRDDFCEVELECVDAEPVAAFEWAARVLGGHPARLVQPSKAARGFSLARGEPLAEPAPLHVSPSDADPVTSAEEAFSQLFTLYARSVAENLYCVMTTTHPEAVHQLRVTLRRLRALLRAGKGTLPDHQRRELGRRARDLGRQVSALRDADVLVDSTIKPLLKPTVRETALLAEMEVWRDRVRTATRESLRRARATAFAVELLEVAELKTWRPRPRKAGKRLRGGLLDLLEPALESAWARVCPEGSHRVKPALEGLSAEERHRLRKDLKTLRYTTEIARIAAEAPGGKRFFKLLGALQDDLGLLNDLATLERLRRPLGNIAGNKVFQSVARRVSRRGADRAKITSRATRRWRKLEKEGPFWRSGH